MALNLIDRKQSEWTSAEMEVEAMLIQQAERALSSRNPARNSAADEYWFDVDLV